MDFYPFDPEKLAACFSPVDEDQLRRDFDYPANARNLELMQLEQRREMGCYYDLLMRWEERQLTKEYNHYLGKWEEVERWVTQQRQLEPRFERYL